MTLYVDLKNTQENEKNSNISSLFAIKEITIYNK